MMTNLFSVFDPSSSLIDFPLNWLSTTLGFLFIPFIFWALPSRWSLVWAKINYTLHKEFLSILGPSNKMTTIIFISLFSMIIFNNFLGLLPYIFTSTSHLVVTLALSLPMWLTFMSYGWYNHSQHMFSHLVPLGTPSILMPFMVLIETISNIIRPATLAVRLSANMMAGHLLLTLLSGTGPSLNPYLMVLLLMTQIALLVLESAVAIIQSYVFAVLTALFSSEVN